VLKKRHSDFWLPTPGFRIGLAAKLAVSLIASTAALFVVFGYFNITEQRRRSEEMVLQSAERVTDVIQRSTHYEMLRNDRQALYNVIQELGSEPGIRRIRIFNKEGRISFSTEAAEVNRVVDKRAEACYGCHAQSAPLVKLNRPDRARIFPGQGERLLGVTGPSKTGRLARPAIPRRSACWGSSMPTCRWPPWTRKWRSTART